MAQQGSAGVMAVDANGLCVSGTAGHSARILEPNSCLSEGSSTIEGSR